MSALLSLTFRLANALKVYSCCPKWLDNTPIYTPPGEGNGNSLQYSCLENCMDRGVWQV